jgi:5-methylcytosine-specific restriction endonuclease McrBC regulatory subunit McrC
VNTIIATERSTEPLSKTQYAQLEESDAFLKLIDNGVVTLIRSRDIPFGVRASSSVGQAVLEDGSRLVIHEKSPGALRTLLEWSLPEDLRSVEVPSAVSATGPVLEIYARQFLVHLGYYLRHGRLKKYRSELTISSNPSGRLATAETAGLFARGIRGKIAHHKVSLTADILVNRLLGLAIREVERLFRTENNDPEKLGLARMYAPLFQDVRTHEIEAWDWKNKAKAFTAVEGSIKARDELRSALAYARALLLHLGAWPEEDQGFKVPDSFFLNLETLFQDAVSQVLTRIMAPLPVSDGASLKCPLFEDLKDRYIADPDFVIDDGTHHPILVGDCKYKELESHPAHSDVYQLVSHCVALNVSTALLVYPGETFTFEELGETQSGAKIYYSTVRLNQLRVDLKTCMTKLSVPLPEALIPA